MNSMEVENLEEEDRQIPYTQRSTRTMPKVAIVGRTNVGKSTLFNALLGRRKAVVEDQSGVTRDRSYATINREKGSFTLIDTGGVVGEEDKRIAGQVRDQVDVAIQESDVVLAVFDVRAGLTPYDEEVVEKLRRSQQPIIWVGNKCEGKEQELASSEFYGLGIDSLICVSAAHRIGLHQIFDAVFQIFEEKGLLVSEKSGELPEGEEADLNKPIRIAVVGRPNVGKSTLVNKLIGEERLVTSAVSGTTRDSIDVLLKRNGRDFILVDTAGLRKKTKVVDHTVERYGNLRTLKSLAGSDVVILLIDATQGLPSLQEKKIASIAHERGKSIIFAVNKWDAVEKDHRSVKAFTDGIYNIMTFARYAPIVFVSALTGRRCPNLIDLAGKVYESARQRIQTAELNRVLKKATDDRPPPTARGETVKFFFATQVAVAPPSIVLFFNRPKEIRDSYQRYLRNTLRKAWPFDGIDIKFELKKRREEDASNK